jgi:hypothetical protein
MKQSTPLEESRKPNNLVLEPVQTKKRLNIAEACDIHDLDPTEEASVKSNAEFLRHDSGNPFEETNGSTNSLKSALKVRGASNARKTVNFNLEANRQFEFIEQSPEMVPLRPTPSHRASIFSKPARKQRKVASISDHEHQPSPMTPKHRALLASKVALNVGKLLLETQSQTPIRSNIESS